jgi:cell wall-associated NlpC family hydrolase
LVTGLALSLAPGPAAFASAPAGGATVEGAHDRQGEEGTGLPPLPFPRRDRDPAAAGITWSDVEAPYTWARRAIDWVGATNSWMRDYATRDDGTTPFKPGALESRKLFARAIVAAFAPEASPDPSIVFSDLDATSPFYPAANVAVQRGWIRPMRDGTFAPERAATTNVVHRALVRAVGLGPTARDVDRLHTADGHAFATPNGFGTLLLGMRLGLRYNNKVDESQDVGPRTRLNRAQVAYSLYRATTLPAWVVPWLADQYEAMELPKLGRNARRIVQWGIRYVGYPYVWGGEWGLASPVPSAFGSQPIPGFDCSGITWWVMKQDGGAWQVAPPRPYRGWALPQRTSRDMATMAPRRIRYRGLQPGDLMFYDGDGDGTVDHVDVYVGGGWAIDSSSSVGGVTFMWVGSGWYRDHFKFGRRVL